MSGFYGQSFLERTNYKELVRECLDAMQVMGAKVAFLPLGGIKAGWENEPELRMAVVKRLKEVGDMAASEVTIANETAVLNKINDYQEESYRYLNRKLRERPYCIPYGCRT